MGRPARFVHPTLQKALDIAGGRRALARLVGCSHQNIAQWEKVPAEQVIAVEKAVGLSREYLRPDVFRAPRPRVRKRA